MDLDRFVADCRDAAAATGSTGVLEVVAKAVAAPSDVLRSLGEPQRAGLHPGITQEVAPNESQRAPKSTMQRALID
jgi:hypothetical protein